MHLIKVVLVVLIECRGRLVHKQEPRFREKHTSKSKPLLLPERQFPSPVRNCVEDVKARLCGGRKEEGLAPLKNQQGGAGGHSSPPGRIAGCGRGWTTAHLCWRGSSSRPAKAVRVLRLPPCRRRWDSGLRVSSAVLGPDMCPPLSLLQPQRNPRKLRSQ